MQGVMGGGRAVMAPPDSAAPARPMQESAGADLRPAAKGASVPGVCERSGPDPTTNFGVLKKTILAIVILLVSFVAALLAAPSFIDWNPYRPAIAAWASQQAGRPVALDGPIALTLLPSPALSVQNLRISDVEGGGGADLLHAARMTAQLNLWPLLAGRAEVTQVVLSQADIVLETAADGSGNWRRGPSALPQPAADDSWLQSVDLRRLVLENSSLTLRDKDGRRTLKLDKLAAELQAEASDGPWALDGGFTLGERAMRLKLRTRRLTAGATALPLEATLTLPDAEGHVVFAGNAALGTQPQLEGTLSVDATRAGAVLALADGTAAALLAQAPLAAEPLEFKGTLAASPRHVSLDGAELTLGDSLLHVSLQHDAPEAPETLGHLTLGLRTTMLPLDGLLPPALLPDIAAAPAALERLARAMPPGLQLDLEADAAKLKGGDLRRLHVLFVAQSDVLQVSSLSALLPGDAELSLSGSLGRSGPMALSLEGKLRSQDARGLLGWAGLLPDDMPPELLRNLSLQTRLQVGPQSLGLRDLSLELDDLSLGGSLFIDRSFAGRLDAAFSGKNLALEQYRPLLVRLGLALPSVDSYPRLLQSLSTAAGSPGALKLALDLGDFNLSPLPPLEKLRVDLERRGEALDLKGLETVSSSGVSMRLQAKVDNPQDLGSASGVAELTAPDGASLEPFVPPGFVRLQAVPGPISLRAQLRNQADTATVNADLRAGADNGIQLAGSLAMLDPAHPQVDATLRATVKDAALVENLLPAVSGAALPPMLRRFDLFGHIVMGDDRLMVSDIQGTVAGTAIAATLAVDDLSKPESRKAVLGVRAGDVDLADLLPGGGDPLALAAQLPMPVELSLTAANVVWGAQRVAGLATMAQLSPGAIDIEKLDGTLNGGRIGLALHRDAERLQLGLTGQGVGVPASGLAWNGWSLAGGTVNLEASLDFPADAGMDPAKLKDGTVKFLMTGGTLGGLDLGAMAAHVAAPPAEGTGAALGAALAPELSRGTTPVQQLFGEVKLAQGVATLNSIDLRSAAGRVSASDGQVDLAQQRLGLELDVQLATPEGAPPFTASILGPLASPNRTVLAGALAQFLSRGKGSGPNP